MNTACNIVGALILGGVAFTSVDEATRRYEVQLRGAQLVARVKDADLEPRGASMVGEHCISRHSTADRRIQVLVRRKLPEGVADVLTERSQGLDDLCIHPDTIGLGEYFPSPHAFGVRLARLMDGRMCIARSVHAPPSEVVTYFTVQHPHFVEFFGFLDDASAPSFQSRVFEFCAGGTLRAYIQRGLCTDRSTQLDVLVQVARGLAFLHQAGIAHSRLEAANVYLLDASRRLHVKLGPLPPSVELDGEADHDPSVLAYWHAPELATGLISPTADMYAG